MLSAPGAALLAAQWQFERTERLSAAALRARQFGQLGVLLEHVRREVPFYRERLAGLGELTPESWARLPVLTRQEVQQAGSALRAAHLPPGHGRTAEHRTTGSLGMPVRVLGTELTHYFWGALTLRDHLWHGRDFAGSLAAIRAGVAGGRQPTWGPPADAVFPTGPSMVLDVSTPPTEQLSWLEAHRPDYLLTYPTNLAALLQLARERGVRWPNLRQVRTIGESLGPEVRLLCQEVWGVPVVDAYSAEEVGYLALQCPEGVHYHVQSEAVYLEVLDGSGRPCAPGEVGRVVVTPLHNFAMPLLRYEIGDYAEVGAPCPCGRGLPVLSRILGRERNMVRLPDGTRRWPLGFNGLLRLEKVRQFQVVQRSLDEIEVRVVTPVPLDAGETAWLEENMRRWLGHDFQVTVAYRGSLPRGVGGKFQDFLCEMDEG